MSLRQMRLVWEKKVSQGEQLILLVLANYADDDGKRVYPSVDRIAWMSSYSERQVRRVLEQLLARGAIERVEPATWDRAAEYRLHLDRLESKPPFVERAQMSTHPKNKNLTPRSFSRLSTQGKPSVGNGHSPAQTISTPLSPAGERVATDSERIAALRRFTRRRHDTENQNHDTPQQREPDFTPTECPKGCGTTLENKRDALLHACARAEKPEPQPSETTEVAK